MNRAWLSLWLLILGVEGGLIVAAWLLGWWLDVPTWATIDGNWADAAIGLAVSVPMLLLFAICTRSPFGPLRRIHEFGDQVVYPLFASFTLIELVLLCTLAGVGEELFFRAFLQGGLGTWVDPWAALLVASAVFGLVHSITPTYAILAGLLGLYLGGCWMLTGNLLVPIIAHGVYDFVALVWLLRVDPPGSDAPGSPPVGQA